MSLTANDLGEIRNVVESVLSRQTDTIEAIKDEIQALRNDIKEIYDLVFGLQSLTITDKQPSKVLFNKLQINIY